MKCLVVTAHPSTNSLCNLLTGKVVNRLQSLNHDVWVEDLYAREFEPSLSRTERESYYDGSYDVSCVAEEVARLREAEALVLLFPTWWFGFPAILKGWFDRVWGPGIAYDHADDFGPIKPRLDNLRKVVAVTTLGAPRWVDHMLLRQPVKKILKTAILGTCARNSRLRFISLYKAESLEMDEISRFSGRVERLLTSWLQ